MRTEDLYVGFQFTADLTYYPHSQGEVCTIIYIDEFEEFAYWVVGEGKETYEFALPPRPGLYYYDDCISLSSFSPWYSIVNGTEVNREPIWEI